MMTAQAIIEEVRRASRTLLTQIESKALLSEVGIPTVETKLARTKEEALLASKMPGFPVALKIASPEITHKNGVRRASWD